MIAGTLAVRVFLHDRTDAEAEQASQVAVWPVFQPFKGNFRWMTCLTNTSRLPVYDWWLEYEVQTEEPAGVWTVHTKKNWLNETVLSADRSGARIPAPPDAQAADSRGRTPGVANPPGDCGLAIPAVT